MNPIIYYRRAQSLAASLLLIVYVFFVSGCSYYRAKTIDPISNETIAKQMKDKKKYVILHNGPEVYHVINVVLDSDKQMITGTLDPLAANHQYYKNTKPSPKANRYTHHEYGVPVDKPIHEIHIYCNSIHGELYSKIEIPFAAMNKLEVYDTHVGATILVYTAAVAATWLALAIFIAATKSSCPFVYVSDGESYSFTGEMYGGAIYPSLERDDYLPLPGFMSADGSYSLKISNELLERQYTNLAHLIVANHPSGSEVLLDKNGKIHSITSPQVPLSTLTTSGADYSREVGLKDSIPYLFNGAGDDTDAISGLMLSFKRPADSNTGKLVLKAKNSFWLDYVYGKFNELFGMYYNTFAEQQKEEPAAKLTQWSLDQNIPLSVYIETSSGWKFVDYFNSIGPLAWRDLVMPIDLSDVKGDEVRIKLESGFMFWEVDYAAMDFSTNLPIEVSSLKPSSAVDEKGVNVANLLSATDDKYLLQPDIGNVVTVTYNALPPHAGVKQSVFLHSRGYYEYIRDYENLPSISYLNSFKEKGAFTKFSRDRFDAFAMDQNLVTAALTQGDEE